MDFVSWITSNYPNQEINGQWGWLHITTLIICIATIVAISLIFRRGKYPKARKIVLWTLVGILFIFELTRRIVNLCKTTDYSFRNILAILLPRPWCAISSWSVMISIFVNKKFFYNFTSITTLLCALVYFAYPGVGFNNQFILFENLYSIVTHSMLLIISILLITLKFTDFRYKGIWKEAICLAAVFIYSILEIFVLKIESDPLYYMPGGDIQEILGIGYGGYLVVYIAFILIFINVFYLINNRKIIFKRKIKR